MTILFGIHSSDCFYAPASGYRTSTTGALTNVGTGGYCWSSTPVSASNPIAGAMAFLSGLVYPLHSADCAYAFPVRCVQHLRAAFLKEWFIFAPTKQLWPGISGATVSGSAAADSAIGHRLEIASRWLCTPVCRRAVLSGIHLSDCFYAPASGYRHRTSGALTSVGVNSQSWSSSPATAGSANASYLVFDATLMYPEYSNSRSYAFPVRCVQHLQGCFLLRLKLKS